MAPALGSTVQMPACHTGGIVSEGPLDAEVMIVSIGPGYEEQKEKRPFVGSSGRLLQDILRAVGYKREDVWLTNVCCDHLGDDEDDARRCLQRLQNEILAVKPRLIIPLGKYPTEMLTADWIYDEVTGDVLADDWQPIGWMIYKPGRSIGKVRGQPLWYNGIIGTDHCARIMPTWQPAAALNEGGASYLQDIIRDLAKLCPSPIGVDLLKWAPDHGKFDWSLPKTEAQLYVLLNSLNAAYPVSIDIETGNSENIEEMTMDVYREKLLCFALGQTVPIPGGGAHTWSFTITPPLYDTFVKWFNARGASLSWLTHYGFFDMQGIRELLGITMQIARDSMSGSHCLDERAGYHRLKTGAREYCGADFWESFIEDDLSRIRAIDKFKARLKPSDQWNKAGMESEDVDLFLWFLDSNGRVKEDLAGEDGWALWQLFKSNWHHSRATMKDESFLETYEFKLLEIDGYGFEKLDPQKLYVYNGEDAARTAQWDAVQRPMLADDGLDAYYRAISIPDLNVNTDMAYEGIPIDLNVRDQLKSSWQPIADRMEQDLQEQARELGYENEDGSPINLASWKQKGKLFYDIMDLTLPNIKGARSKKTGLPSTNIKVLEEMKEQTDFIPKMIAWSHANHQLGAYINPMPSFVRSYDEQANFGINHPVYKPHATRTNRGAYSNPPWHQFPKYVQFDAEPEFEGDDPFHAGKDALRRMVVPWLLKADGTIDKTRYIFVEADLKSAEQYANAYLSGDAKFLEDIRSGDLHEAAARNIYKLPRSEYLVWEEVPEHGKKRREGKVLNFGVAYDMKEVSLGQLLKVSTFTAKNMLDAYWDGYPDFRDWSKAVKFDALKTGRVVAPSGRVRHFGLIIGEDSHHELAQASNFPAQNTVTDSMKMSKAQLHLGSDVRKEQGAEYLYTDGIIDTPPLSIFDSRILFDIHDMLGFMVRTDYFQEVVTLISTVMTQAYFGIPGIPIDIAAGPTWGDTTLVENIDGVWILTDKHA